MARHGKKYRESAMRYDKQTQYQPREALELVKTLAPAKFDETVEAAFNLGIDPKKADQLVRGTVSLPHGTGQDGPGRRLRDGGQGERGHRGRRRRGGGQGTGRAALGRP